MYDALAPAVDALDAAVAEGQALPAAMRAAVAAAEKGQDATIPLMPARAGRAISASAVRDIRNPGATSVTLLLTAAATTLDS